MSATAEEQVWSASDESWDSTMDAADAVASMCADDPALLVGVLRRLAGTGGMSVTVRTRQQVEAMYGRGLTEDEWRRVATSSEWLDAEWDGDVAASLDRTRRLAGVWPRS